MNLTPEQKQKLGVVLGVLVTMIYMVASLFGIYVEKPAAAPAGGGIGVQAIGQSIDCGAGVGDCVTGRFGRGITVYSNDRITQTFKVAGSSGTMTMAGLEILSPQSITVTNGNNFTPTATYVYLYAATAVTPTIATAGYAAGTRLIFENESAQTIRFVDAGTQALAATVDLGLEDTLTLIFDGTNWVQLSTSNN